MKNHTMRITFRPAHTENGPLTDEDMALVHEMEQEIHIATQATWKHGRADDGQPIYIPLRYVDSANPEKIEAVRQFCEAHGWSSYLDGEALRARREALDMSQSQLARALGIDANTLARWERGDMPIGNPILLDLALQTIERDARLRQR